MVFLDMPTRTCLAGLLRRRLRFRGQLRPERGVYDVIGWEFIRWIWSFRRVHRPRVLDLLAGCLCEVVVLRSRRVAFRSRVVLQRLTFPLAGSGRSA